MLREGGDIGDPRSTKIICRANLQICPKPHTDIFETIDWPAPPPTERICNSVGLIGVEEVQTHLYSKSFPRKDVCGRSYRRFKIDQTPKIFHKLTILEILN